MEYAISLHGALLADAGGVDQRAQSPLRRFRDYPGQSTGYPGYDSVIGPENATIGTILQQNGYATSWFGENHNTPSYQYSATGPFDHWPNGMGFDYFYDFMGGETDQWTPYLFQNTTQVSPWVGKPGYNLTTDLADEAIGHIQRLDAAAPDKPFFVYYVPGGTHSPPSRRRSGSTSSRASLIRVAMSCASNLCAEVFAAFAAYTDHEIGRVIQAIDDIRSSTTR